MPMDKNGSKKNQHLKHLPAVQNSILINAGSHVNGSQIVYLIEAHNVAVAPSEAKASHFFDL